MFLGVNKVLFISKLHLHVCVFFWRFNVSGGAATIFIQIIKPCRLFHGWTDTKHTVSWIWYWGWYCGSFISYSFDIMLKGGAGSVVLDQNDWYTNVI